MTRQIFRKAALNRLASPDQLDQLMQVTSPRSWIALAGFALVLLAALVWGLVGTVTTTVDGKGVLLRGSGVQPLPAPIDGVVTKFLRRSGEDVKKGQPLVLLTPAPGQSPQSVESPFEGRMLNRVAKQGQPVKKGAALLMLEPLDAPLRAWLYIPVSDGYKIHRDMLVHVWPASVKKDEFGYVKGRVIAPSLFPITRQELADRLQNEDLAASLSAGGPKLQIMVELIADPDTFSGYQWSSTKGPPVQLYSGTPCQAEIVTGDQRPIQLVFPALGR